MADPEVASVEIVEVPRLSIARLLDLRVLLDSVLACGPGKEILGGEADGQVLVECTARSIRRATAGHATRCRRAGESTEQLQALLTEAMADLSDRQETGDDKDHA